MDINTLAAKIVDEATDEREPGDDQEARSLAAAILGRSGGIKGGPARAASLSAERRKEIAKKAALARWAKGGDEKQ